MEPAPSRAGLTRGGLLALLSVGLLVTLATASGAAFSAQAENPGNSITAANDLTAPVISATVIAPVSGGSPGSVAIGSAYYVYASASDEGNPPSGIATVRANLSAITLVGATSVPLVSGSYTVGGQSYNYRSGSEIVTLATPGTVGYSVTATDGASNSTTANGTVQVTAI